MIDHNSQFFAILTNIGAAKQANADALGVPWKLAQMAVGDANGAEPQPDASQTALINEWRRAPLNQLRIDPGNSAIIVAEQVIPADVGGKWIREIGLYDSDGDLVAVANCAPTFKPLLNQGSGRTQIIRINLLVSNTSNVELKIDPSVVLATRKYVDDSLNSVIPADKRSGTFTKVTINARGLVVKGSNPTTLEGYGIAAATQQDAEAGEDNSKPITALRVWQAISKRAIQSTEAVAGIARTASQPELEEGVDDSSIVTPKKLLFGFVFSWQGDDGYVAFPTWLGGLIFQFGRMGVSATDKITLLPVTFPREHYVVIANNDYTAGSGFIGYVAARPHSLSTIISKASSASLGAFYPASAARGKPT
jgi:phage-related tail fiber protein